MLEEILDNLHNSFAKQKRYGEFRISQGALDVDFLLPGQYFRIAGSVLNDGVYQYPVTGLRDELFTGEIWSLAVPKAVLDLADEIGAWVADHPATDLSSESFGGYSYNRASGKNGAPISWQDVFAARLSRWRKPYE